jgi:hypothetical protein
MTSKKGTEKNPAVKGKKSKTRTLSIFPINIGRISRDECAKLSFKPNSMADTILQALQKSGVEAGEKRAQVFEQVKSKFGDASNATIRTQIYRGIVLRRTELGLLEKRDKAEAE